jgi:mRNA-degrading endonuclease RelE of RelBE toxin-antitoxin system
MKPFIIVVNPSVIEDINNAPNEIAQNIFTNISSLQQEPFPSDVEIIQVKPNTCRTCVGDYKIIYEVNEGISLINILYIRHRDDVFLP